MAEGEVATGQSDSGLLGNDVWDSRLAVPNSSYRTLCLDLGLPRRAIVQ